MNVSFDLVQMGWVPCIRLDGTRAEVSLRDALVQADQLREVADESPLVTAALYRLLLAVLHRVFGPSDYDNWHTLWRAGRWDHARLDGYLDRWRHRFDLFDPKRPFYQAADDRVRPKSVTSLIPEVASGNNATLFDHHTDTIGMALGAGEAARKLVSVQAFGLGGLSGIAEKFTDAPAARGIVFLVEGETLFETLALNLLPYPDETIIPQQADDLPAWEMDDPFRPARSRPRGYLDYLTWQNRRVLLLPEATPSGTLVRQMTMAPGLRLHSSVVNPMAHYRRHEKLGPLALCFTESRALWRDSAALFSLHDKSHRPPSAFGWLAELADQGYLVEHQTRPCVALGMSKKQARVAFFRAERMPLPLRYLTEKDLVDKLGAALAMAEGAARQLWGATRTLATFVLAPQADTESGQRPARKDLDDLMAQWAVERRYWSQLERPFRQIMAGLPAEGNAALAAWRKTLLRAAWQALGSAADSLDGSPRRLKAEVRARGQLAAGLARALPVEEWNP